MKLRHIPAGVPPSGGSHIGASAPPATSPTARHPGLKALAGFRLKPVLRPDATRGFMLIELAVAALDIGIGILALLGLTHVAERAAYDAEAETRARLFADVVFTTLRLYSDRYAQSANQMEWLEFWVEVADGKALPLAAEWLSLWESSVDPIHPRTIAGDSQEHTAYWIPIADDAEPATMPDYALRYRLTLARPGETSSEAVDLTTQPLPAMLLATLHVWYGASKVTAEPYTFFTAFSNSGSLP